MFAYFNVCTVLIVIYHSFRQKSAVKELSDPMECCEELGIVEAEHVRLYLLNILV